jgi:hypothetical protein
MISSRALARRLPQFCLPNQRIAGSRPLSSLAQDQALPDNADVVVVGGGIM